jgi:hypothetical protein
VVFFYKNKKAKLCATNLSYIQCDQQENKVRVLHHILFYRNVSLILIVHIECILTISTVVLLVAYLSKNLLRYIN